MEDNSNEFFNRTTIYRYETINKAYIRYPNNSWHIQGKRGELDSIDKLVYMPENYLKSNRKITQEVLNELDKKTKNCIQEGGRLINIISNNGTDKFYISDIITSIKKIIPNLNINKKTD